LYIVNIWYRKGKRRESVKEERQRERKKREVEHRGANEGKKKI
jgi:hypothetical protein